MGYGGATGRGYVNETFVRGWVPSTRCDRFMVPSPRSAKIPSSLNVTGIAATMVVPPRGAASV